MPENAAARKVGFWAACCAATFSTAYIIAQLFEWSGALGSAGGPENASTPLGLAILLTPSLLLGSAFLVLMAALHVVAPTERKVFSQAALAFATAYATLISLVYFVQLTLVAPRLSRGDTADIAAFLFVPYESFLFAVDLLGYSFMSLATLLGAFGLPSSVWSRSARIAMTANGLLLPFLAFQMFFHDLIWIATLWAVTFPASAVLLAMLFRQMGAESGTRF
jgi:hypothetical protein